jgi:hypothetical protein
MIFDHFQQKDTIGIVIASQGKKQPIPAAEFGPVITGAFKFFYIGGVEIAGLKQARNFIHLLGNPFRVQFIICQEFH